MPPTILKIVLNIFLSPIISQVLGQAVDYDHLIMNNLVKRTLHIANTRYSKTDRY